MIPVIKTKYPAITLSLITVLLAGLTPKSASADKKADEDKPVRLYVTAGTGPIGRIESVNPIPINGRVSPGEQLIWGGEILQAPIDRSVRVSLDSIGQVTLHRGAVARLAATWRRTGDNIGSSILIASLIQGNVVVKLQGNAEAYVEASGSVLTSSLGASFNVGTGENGPVWSATAGTVEVEPQPQAQGNYMIRPVGGRANIDVRLRKTRQVQFIVTDEHDKPVPDIPIIITISGGASTFGAGATSVTVPTNALGIASAPVTGGSTAGPSTISAVAPNGARSALTVNCRTGILTGTTVGVVAAVVAAATTTVILVNRKGEVKPSSGPSVTPSSIR
jgi:hypothetical protein